MENRKKWRKLVCKIIRGAPTTLAVKGLMMMMMMMMVMMMMMMMGRFNAMRYICIVFLFHEV